MVVPPGRSRRRRADAPRARGSRPWCARVEAPVLVARRPPARVERVLAAVSGGDDDRRRRGRGARSGRTPRVGPGELPPRVRRGGAALGNPSPPAAPGGPTALEADPGRARPPRPRARRSRYATASSSRRCSTRSRADAYQLLVIGARRGGRRRFRPGGRHRAAAAALPGVDPRRAPRARTSCPLRAGSPRGHAALRTASTGRTARLDNRPPSCIVYRLCRHYEGFSARSLRPQGPGLPRRARTTAGW